MSDVSALNQGSYTDLVSYLRILNVVSPAIPEILSVLFFYTMYIYLAAVWDLGSHCVTCVCSVQEGCGHFLLQVFDVLVIL